MTDLHVPPDDIRTWFSVALSNMYKAEVPQYGMLLDLVREVNGAALRASPGLDRHLAVSGEAARMDVERHGAIRLGTPTELHTMRRLFAVMGMAPVGYYDLSVAGIPVHSTAFRPITDNALLRNPFRVFTSLLRLELIADEALRREAAAILERRAIFTPGCLALIESAERQGGLTEGQTRKFVDEALETFRWHQQATVSFDVYRHLKAAHPLVADVVSFRGPHINHLTPRTLDIDAAQRGMIARGLSAKAVIEGPPRRNLPILLRQTSFKALEEPVSFAGDGVPVASGHTARFGEIEQRGVALTPKGRALYDELLAKTRADAAAGGEYAALLERNFEAFPDCEDELRRRNLAYFRYVPATASCDGAFFDLEAKLASGELRAEPVTYEDFLPVSAAGIFRSNLGEDEDCAVALEGHQAEFERALGARITDPDHLYWAAQVASKRAAGLAVF